MARLGRSYSRPIVVLPKRTTVVDVTTAIDNMRALTGLADATVWTDAAGDATRIVVGLDTAQDATHLIFQVSSLAATGAGQTTVTAHEAVPATWYWIDVVYAPGEWAAAWIDGDGPYIITGTDVPADTEGLEPGAIVKAIIASARRFSVDVIHVERVDGVIDPSLLEPN